MSNYTDQLSKFRFSREIVEHAIKHFAPVPPVAISKNIAVGSWVIFTNDYGVKWLQRCTGFEAVADQYGRNIMTDSDAYWFGKKEEQIAPVEAVELGKFDGGSVAYFVHDEHGLCEVVKVETNSDKMTKELLKLSNALASRKVIHFKECGSDKVIKSLRDNTTTVYKEI